MTMLTIGTRAEGGPFEVPADIVTEATAIVGQRKAGKTYLAGVVEEELCKAGIPWVCLDPIGHHWGIKASADGKGQGFPVVVFGGRHADLPLPPTAGAAVADAVMQANVPAILDLSRMTKADQRRVVADFVRRLFEENDAARLVILEEAPSFVPQVIRPDGAVAYGEVERLVTQGRGSGLGCLMLTQRTQALNKSILELAETLICFRVGGPKSREAIEDWVEVHANRKEVEEALRSLPKLPAGEAWVWSPHFLGGFYRMRTRARETFHAGAGLKVGERRLTPAAFADVAGLVEKLGKVLAAHPVPTPAKGARRGPARPEALAAAEELLAPNLGAEHQRALAAKDARIQDLSGLVRLLEGKAAQLDQGLQEAYRRVEALEAQGRAGQLLRQAVAELGMGERFAPPLAADEDAIVEKVLARLPAGTGGPVVLQAPAALRAEYQAREVARTLEAVAGLSPLQRDILRLLVPVEGFVGQPVVAQRLGRSPRGGSRADLGKACRGLAAAGFVEVKERQGVRCRLREQVAEALAFYEATPEEVEATVQQVVYALAGGKGGTAEE